MISDQNEPAIALLLRKLEARDTLSAEEREAMVAATGLLRQYQPRARIVAQGEPLSNSMLLVEGFVIRYKDGADGRRIVLEVHVPGDFIDLQGFLLKRLEHDMAAVNAVSVVLVPHDRLTELTREQPHVTRLLWFTTLVEAAIHRQWIVSNGRRSAVGRVAHLFCELRVRLEVIGRADETGYALPFVQADVADATGLTAIHVNRMLRQLRDEGAMTFRDGRVTIHDLSRLERIAEFDPAYLFLEHRPR